MTDILETCVNYGCFKTFVRACNEAGLEAMFSHEGDFTIFAPIDKAFEKISDEKLKNLFKDPAKLMNLILYHAVEWSLDSRALSEAKKLRTLREDVIKVNAKKNNIKINNQAQIIEADIEADNGLIHMIDAVLIPPDLKELK